MFTGIVQSMCRVREVDKRDFGVRFVVERGGWAPEGGATLRRGDSVCISGVCLSLVEHDEQTVAFDVITETLRLTTLGGLRPGDPVNVEPSLTPSSFLGGHFLQGHVDGVGEVTAVQDDPSDWRITLRPPADLMKYVIPKGSIAIDGVSMTLASVGDEDFTVAVIPTTLEVTTLGVARAGTRMNLETDILTRTIVHHLERLAPQA